MQGGPGREILRDHAGAALAILSALAFRFHRLVLEGVSVLNDEMADEYHPLSANVFGQLRRGDLPLWSPEILFGYPVAVTPDLHLFSPFSWAHALFEPHVALGLQMASIQLVAAFGMYALARRLGAKAWGAAVASVLWVSGCPADNMLLVSMCLATIPWIPLVLLLWHRYASLGDLRRAAVAGGALGLALLGGQAQFVYWTLLVAVAYLVFVVRPFGAWRKDVRRAASGAAVTGALAAAIAAVTVLPTVELLRDSIRASLQPEERILDPELSLSQAWRALRWTVFCGKERPGVEGDVDYRSAGMLPVALALLAIGRGRRLDNRLLALGLALLLLSLGTYFLPSHWIVSALPFNNFRYPARIGLFSSILILLLAGRGADRLLGGAASRRGLVAIGALAALCAPGIVELLCSGDWLAESEGRRSVAALLLPALALALPFPARPWPVLRRMLVLLAVAWGVVHSQLVTNEAGWITARAWGPTAGVWGRRGDRAPTSPYPRAYLQWVPRGDAHGPTRILRLDSRYEHDVPMLTGHHSPLGLVSLRPARVDRLVYDRYRASDNEAPLEDALARKQTLLDLFNVRYLVVYPHRIVEHFDATQRERSMVAIRSLGRFALVENRTHLPRAFFVGRARAVSTEEEARALLTSEGFDPRREVVLEAGEGLGAMGEGAPFRPATVTRYENERVEVEVSAPGPGWLVLLDRWAPGWTATLDGAPAPILRADYLFRAVAVPGGRHGLVFEYRNAAFQWGLGLSALGVAAALGAALSLWRARRS
jgi:hypothetical protein